MRLLKSLFVIVFISFIGGCKDEPNTPMVMIEGNEILISNEGNFGWGDGTLSLYNPSLKTVQNEVYKNKNGKGLGNVFQSISHEANQYFFVINNSNKIVVTNDSFDFINEISGLTSPRYFYKVSENKAYVTDLYSKAISVVDLQTLTSSNEIKMNGWTEKGVISNGSFWVTNVESEYVYIIDITTDKVTDSVAVGFAPESIILDREGVIWTLNKGDASTNKQPGLTAINSNTKQIIRAITLTGLPTNLVYTKEANQLYFLNNGIYKMLADTASAPQVWKESNNNNFYGLGVDPSSGDIYTSDIHDFIQKSTIYRYSKDGILIDEFKTGIIAGNFFFPQK